MTKNNVNNSIPKPEANLSFETATGKIRYNLLNDYLFRIVMQKNPEALKQIISAILKIPIETITDLEITNSIIPGEAINNKEFRMDITVKFRNTTSIDIELQVNNEYNWKTRGLVYLCRQYDNLIKRGGDYDNNLAAYQISLLDFTLFDDNVEFLARYEMIDIKTKYKYNSNFALFVVDLSRIDLATEDDKKSGLDTWSRLFKATTWEELKSLAKENEIMEAVANDVFTCESDEAIQKRLEDREDYLRHERFVKERMATLTAENEVLTSELNNLTSDYINLTSEVERLRALLKKHNISDET